MATAVVALVGCSDGGATAEAGGTGSESSESTASVADGGSSGLAAASSGSTDDGSDAGSSAGSGSGESAGTDESSGTTGSASRLVRVVVVGSSGDPDYNPQFAPPPPANEGFIAAFTFGDPEGAGVSLDWTRLHGGMSSDTFNDVAIAPDRTVYAAGHAGSGDLPTTDGVVQPESYNDAWLARLDADGELLMMSYVGGSFGSHATAISVDEAGYVYVSGTTASDVFPVTAGAYQTGVGSQDYFITKLEPDASAYGWVSRVGGPDYDEFAGGHVVDESGTVFLLGATASFGFPTTQGAFSTTNNGTGDEHHAHDATILALAADGTQLAWSTYLGGSSEEFAGDGIAVAQNGDLIVCGTTHSGDFPIVGGVQQEHAGEPAPTTPVPHFSGDAFVARLSADGSTLVASTYFGGSQSDRCVGLGLDEEGSVVIAVETDSADFPLESPLQNTIAGVSDVGVVKLSPTLDAVLFSTYLGGSEIEWVGGVHPLGDGIYLAGTTFSADFPVTADATRPTHEPNDRDAFVVKLRADGQAIEFGTYLGFESASGNPHADTALAIAVATE